MALVCVLEDFSLFILVCMFNSMGSMGWPLTLCSLASMAHPQNLSRWDRALRALDGVAPIYETIAGAAVWSS